MSLMQITKSVSSFPRRLIERTARSPRPRHYYSKVLLVPVVSVCLFLSACGSPSALSRQLAGPVLLPASPSGVLSGLSQAYMNSDWSQVDDVVADHALAGQIVQEMRTWKSEDVKDLHVDSVYTQRESPTSWIVTARFSSDPRATPEYHTYRMQQSGKTVRISGVPQVLRGTSFLNANWSVTRSAHFAVYHDRYQLQGVDRKVLADLEFQRSEFQRKFHVSLAAHTNYYLYPAVSLMAQLTRGGCGSRPENVGCANPLASPPTIHTTLWPTYHEPIHVYELAFVPPPKGNLVYVAPLFITEGTAVALEDRQVDPNLSDYCSDLAYAPLNHCARYAAAQTKAMSLLSDHGFEAADPGSAYSLGGSFVRYLIGHGGYLAFKHFYYVLAAQPKDRVQDYDVAARSTYHRSIAQLITAWQSDLCGGRC